MVTPTNDVSTVVGSKQVEMAYQTFQQEYLQIPVVTRTYTTACVLTTAAVVSTNVLAVFWGLKLVQKSYQLAS